MERIIFGPAGDAATSLDVLGGLGRARVARDTRTRDSLARGDTRTRDGGSNANTRDAGTGAGSVTTTTTGSGTVTVTTVTGATSTGDVGMFDGGETILTARGDPDRVNRSSRSSSSSSSVSRSHWPGPVQLPEWIDEERAPSHFKCPITLCVMREPAVTPAGIIPQRSALMQWLDHQHVEPSTKRRFKALARRAQPDVTRDDRGLAPARADVRAGTRRGGCRFRRHQPDRSGVPLVRAPRAAAVSHADRDALRAVRQRMYAALRNEPRWACVTRSSDGGVRREGARGQGANDDGTQPDGDAGDRTSRRRRAMVRRRAGRGRGIEPRRGERLDVESSSQSSPPTPAVSGRRNSTPGSLDATLDDDAMND